MRRLSGGVPGIHMHVFLGGLGGACRSATCSETNTRKHKNKLGSWSLGHDFGLQPDCIAMGKERLTSNLAFSVDEVEVGWTWTCRWSWRMNMEG